MSCKLDNSIKNIVVKTMGNAANLDSNSVYVHVHPVYQIYINFALVR